MQGKNKFFTMGQAFSKQDRFIRGYQDTGSKGKKKDIRKFLDYIGDLCLWLPLEVTIDEMLWLRVGDCLRDVYHSFVSEKMPVSAFSYWNLINDILRVYNHHPDINDLISEGEKVLKETSWPASRAASQPASHCPSIIIDMSDEETVPLKPIPDHIVPQLESKSPKTKSF